MPTYPAPAALAEATAIALGGTTHSQTQLAYLAKGVGPNDSPALYTRLMREAAYVRKLLSSAAALMAVDEGGLNIGVFPGKYRKADNTDVSFDGDTAYALDNNATNYVYLDIATNAVLHGTAGWPADKTTFIPLAIFVTSGGDITTGDEDADRRHLCAYWPNATSTSPTGTTGTTFELDSDNAGAGANQQVQFNRGSTDAENAAWEWDETNDRFNARKQHSTATYCPVNASEFQVGGTACIESDGDLAAASIATDQLYTFGAQGDPANGLKLTATGSSGTPAAGAHTKGELAVDTDGKLYICTANGTPGTWQVVGKQNLVMVPSVGDGSGTAAGAVNCSIQVKDAHGNNVAQTVLLIVNLMDDVDGAAFAANTSAISASVGSVIRTITANKTFVAKTNSSGLLTFAVTNSIADNVYVLVEPGPGSPALDCQDYGTLTWT